MLSPRPILDGGTLTQDARHGPLPLLLIRIRDNMPGRFWVGVLIRLTIVAHIFGG